MNTEKFSAALNIAEETLVKYGFSLTEQSEGLAKYVSSNGESELVFKYENGKLLAFNENEKRIIYSLLPEDASDKDVKYVAGEIIETLNDKFGEKSITTKGGGSAKKPQTVSKNSVKNGSAFYDETTLASKLGQVFPSLRDTYKANTEKYGEFLAQEFFTEYATPLIIDAIKANRPDVMKKLFKVLNEMYEDGTNSLQSLIAVTILGELNNDQVLLARCVDYMSETMAPPVIEVNKLLASGKGKRLRSKMKNPPAYKPPKKKKQGFMAKMMDASAAQQNSLQNK